MDRRYEGAQRKHVGAANAIASGKLLICLETDDGDEVEIEFPARAVVCDTCGGKGSHVHPDIDSHGISAREFAEDPDFRDEYFSGAYDVACYECGGLRVVPEINEDLCVGELKQWYELWLEQERDRALFERESAMERAMGA